MAKSRVPVGDDSGGEHDPQSPWPAPPMICGDAGAAAVAVFPDRVDELLAGRGCVVAGGRLPGAGVLPVPGVLPMSGMLLFMPGISSIPLMPNCIASSM